MNETHTTQIQFPTPGQRRRLAIAAIAATAIVSTALAVGRGSNEHRATPPVYLRDAVQATMDAPVAVLEMEAPETILSDWELQAAVDDFCVSYRHLFDLDPATGERPQPRGCSGAIVPTIGESSVDFELGIESLLTYASR